MGYGHGPNLIGKATAAAEGKPEPPPVDPALWWREDMRAALWVRDIGTVYRLVLEATGMSQHRLAVLVGQGQSEVSEILRGRQVKDITVLERIADGLGIPRELMRLSAYSSDGTYCGMDEVVGPAERVSLDMIRRKVLALGGIAAFGAPFGRIDEATEGARLAPTPAPLPDRLSQVHVAQVRDLTRHLREVGNAYGSDPVLSSAAAERATWLRRVSAQEPVKRAYTVAVAGLHAEAGWSAFDAGLYERTMYHCGRALELATEAEDPYHQTLALNYAGLATIEHGDPNEGLKMLQYGQVTAWRIPLDLDPSTVAIGVASRMAHQACGLADSATALAALGVHDAADRHQDKARGIWMPSRTDPAGDLDIVAARIELDRGRLDRAEQFATASLRRWEGGASRRARTRSEIVLATIHVRAAERDALARAHNAITAATRLTSVRSRRRLDPLAAALDAYSGPEAKELARMARKVAATRA